MKDRDANQTLTELFRAYLKAPPQRPLLPNADARKQAQEAANFELNHNQQEFICKNHPCTIMLRA